MWYLRKLWLILLAALFCFPAISHAYTGVTIITSEASANNIQFVNAFKESLAANKNNTMKVTVLLLKKADKLVLAENSELVVALGTKALDAASKLKHTTPVLSVFTPTLEFNRILVESKRNFGNCSLVMLDQPYSRQLLLIKNMLPDAKNLSMLLGNSSSQFAKFYQESAEKNAYIVSQQNIYQDSEIIPKLKLSLGESDAFLAIADEQVFNSDTAKSILSTSYQYQKPVFAFSQAFVRAGALAAVYSDISQVAKQSAEIAYSSQKAPALLPAPQVPKYFSVMINHHVARMLNIDIVDEKQLVNTIKTAEIIEMKKS
jgi:putative tryptophan/tyrosine transport system substrate-binding protein